MADIKYKDNKLFVDNISLDNIDTKSAQIEHTNNPEWMSVVTDNDGKMLGGRNTEGKLVENVGILSPNITELEGKVNAIINQKRRLMHVIGYGQSLMSGSYSGEPVSTTIKYNNLYKFKGGVRTYDAFGLNSTKATHITRNGNPTYGELFINPEDKLSAYDYEVLIDSLSTLVPLTEKRPKYKENTDISIDDAYIQDDNGSYYNIHQNGETVLTSFCNAYNECKSRGVENYQFDYDILASCAAYGSAPYVCLLPLDRGGSIHGGIEGANFNYFDLLMAQVVYGKKYADANNLDYSVDYILYFEEHTDQDSNPNKNIVACRILQLFSIINSRVRSITGQRNDIKFIVPSSNLSNESLTFAINLIVMGEGNIELSASEKEEIAQLPNHDIKPYSMSNVFAGHSSYGYAFGSDGVHHTSSAQKKIGTVIGTNIANGNFKNPLYPTNVEVDGTDIF